MANKWVLRSISLAKRTRYLDQLYDVYPIKWGGERTIDPSARTAIREAHQRNDARALLRVLNSLPRFPIDHPFATLIRIRPELADHNPETLRRIAEPLLGMSTEKLLALCTKPKPPNTQVGPMFRKWLPSIGYVVLPESEFRPTRRNPRRDVAILKGNDKTLKDYANRHLDCGLRKGLDLLLRVGGDHMIGQVKFWSSSGGNQNNAFDEAMDFLGGHVGRARRIAVLDGAVWLAGIDQKIQREIRNCEGVALSALLLRRFIESLRHG